MSLITPRVVKYAADECMWQQSGEASVFWMIKGWMYCHRHRNRLPTLGDILKLSHIVEPRTNSGFVLRDHGVQVGRGPTADVKMHPALIYDALDRLIDATPPLDSITEEEATQWFKAYEDIHPFGDGNGRTGSLLLNWLRGSLPAPVHPPNLWNDPRRTAHAGYPIPQV